ncbi:MAG: threonine/serine dehydratase [Candidatus Aminicenantes bacterium]|nr:MAG: threonine/serine dehydratase [Candidatus Aminicenantes bacterium]
MKFLAEEVRRETLIAEEKIRKYIRETPIEHSIFLSRLGGCNVFLKCENLQLTGSFKLRGALNKLLSFSKEELDRGLMTASSGNHGAAFAWLMNKFDLNGTIILPDTTAPTKIDTLLLYGVDIIKHGDDCIKAERFGRQTAQAQGLSYIPPYNDPQIIGGQGTIGIELARQVPSVDCVVVPVGGGGLIAGISGYHKSENPDFEILGCQPENSAVMHASVKAGQILDLESLPTISDGSAGGIEQDSITFPICQELVDDFILLTEEEIISALKLMLEKHYLLVEGAGALSVAAFIKQIDRFKGKNVVLILSGSKISLDTLKEIL